MEKMNGKLVTFTGIIVLVLLVAIFGFLFWEPKPEYIQNFMTFVICFASCHRNSFNHFNTNKFSHNFKI